MKGSTAKENILKKIRQALANPVPVPFAQGEGSNNLFQPLEKEIEVEFAENFTSLQGRFSFCANEKELAEQLNAFVAARPSSTIYCQENDFISILKANGFNHFNATDVAHCTASITGCELLVARTGSIFLSSAQASGRTVSVYAPIHICIAYTDQLVYDIKEGLQMLRDKYNGDLPSFVTLATGPSRTADIEKTLVVGVHGPREVYVFLVER